MVNLLSNVIESPACAINCAEFYVKYRVVEKKSLEII
jgi:hypothetical protein